MTFAPDHLGITDMDANYRRAVELLTSDRVRAAFDVSRESDEVRTRYGASIVGQSCLLAHRLVEAGTWWAYARSWLGVELSKR